MSTPDHRDPKAPTFAAKSLARLAELSSKLPSLPESEAARTAKPASDPQAPLARALASRIVISRDSRGRGGKTVTFARGIGGTPKLLEELARELRHELGTGVRVENGALVVQGALTERLAAALARRGAARIVLGN